MRVAAPSLRLSVFALTLACVMAAQAAAWVGLQLLPQKGPPPVTPAAMAAALRFDPPPQGLHRSIASSAPFPATPVGGHLGLIVRALQPLLAGSGLSDVRVVSLSRAVWVETEGAPPILATPSRQPSLEGLASAPFPSFAAAARASEGRWVVVRPVRPLLSPDQLGEPLAFLFSVALLAPLTWWSAHRLSRPLRALTMGSRALGQDWNTPPLPLRGPTEVRFATAAFNAMQARVSGLLEERSKVMAAIAHDLRTPLTSLRLRAESAPLVARELMAGDVARMEALIADLLIFAQDGRTRAPRKPLDLGDLAREAAEDARTRGALVEVASGPHALVFGESASLRRVVDNLLTNAAAYAGSCRLAWGIAANDEAFLEVDDDGPGIPPDALERVFEPFHRLEPSRSRATGGVGLGLAIARDIARAHGGDVRLTLRKPYGLSARLNLPMMRSGPYEKT